MNAHSYAIRDERPGDEGPIYELTRLAFSTSSQSSGLEGQIVNRLRETGDLAVSLVAEEDGRIIGHVAFSPATIGGRHDGWFVLGPISVTPERQRHGVGKALIRQGLERLKRIDARGCVLVGNPQIYSRMDFHSNGALTFGDLDPALIQQVVFSGAEPAGELGHAQAFNEALASSTTPGSRDG